MSELSGSLEDFPLPDVLRLLARGTKHGVLHVYGDVVRGRVYLDEGRIAYATTRTTDDFAEGAGAEGRSGSDRRRLNLDEVGDEDPELFGDYLKLQITEVLVRLGRETSGSFVFQNGITPEEAVKEPFEVDEILAGAEAELKEWTRIEAIIGTTSQPMTMVVPIEDDREIKLTGVEWNTLGILAQTATTRDVAERLQIFEIVAGRVIARLVEEGLVEVAMDPKAARPPAPPLDEPVVEPIAEPIAEAPPPIEPMAEVEPVTDGEGGADDELSEDETREVLSALTQRDEPPSADGFEGLGEEDVASRAADADSGEHEASSDGEQPPASELARRWRNLRAGGTES